MIDIIKINAKKDSKKSIFKTNPVSECHPFVIHIGYQSGM